MTLQFLNKIKLFLLLFLTISYFSCNKEEKIDSKKYSLSINSYSTTSRTVLDSDLQTVKWSIGDNIYLWAQNENNSLALTGQEFILRYYGSDYSTATFTSNTNDPMTEGDYKYYSVYPTPNTISGNNVTMNISDIQSGEYDGVNDILRSNIVTGTALEDDPLRDVSLSFEHITHALRIAIPENKNLLGEAIRSMELTFNKDVVGELSFDVSDTNSTPTLINGSNTITVNLATNVDAGGDYVWVFIAPIETSDLEVSIRATGENGYISQSASAVLDRDLSGGKITPISLTIPEAGTFTSNLNFTIDSDKLGEAVTDVVVTAPSGAEFVGYGETATLSEITNEEFSLVYSYKENVDIDFLTQDLTITYESTNAKIEDNIYTLSGLSLDSDNAIALTTPYLFEQYFSSVSTYDSNSTTANSNPSAESITGATGFTGARFASYINTSVCIVACRYASQNFVGTTSRSTNRGRMDSGAISNLKKATNVTVSFNISGKTTGSGSASPIFMFGTTTTSGNIKGNVDISSLINYGTTSSSSVNVSAITGASNLDGSYTNIGGSATYSISSCTSSTRLSFMVNTTESISADWMSSSSAFYYVYIDNIKVSISN